MGSNSESRTSRSDICPGCGIANRMYDGTSIAHDKMACVDRNGAPHGRLPDLDDSEAVERWLATD